jgi:hypothetical protein
MKEEFLASFVFKTLAGVILQSRAMSACCGVHGLMEALVFSRQSTPEMLVSIFAVSWNLGEVQGYYNPRPDN